MRRLREPRFQGCQAAWQHKTQHHPSDAKTFRSRDAEGEVHFLLLRETGGLYVEREEFPIRGMHSVQHARFLEREEFVRWCGHDPLRWRDPLVLSQVSAAGGRLLCDIDAH